MTKIYKILLLLMALAAFAVPAVLGASEACRSEAGGYCVNLAAAQYAQIESFLKDAKPETLIPQLYVWGLSLVGISALVVLVLGGFMYLTARDSADQVKRAQGFMTNAIFGLIIALLSWLLLNTINPDLVKGGFPTIPDLAPVSGDGGGGVAQKATWVCPGTTFTFSGQQECAASGCTQACLKRVWVCSSTKGTSYACQEKCNAACTAGTCKSKDQNPDQYGTGIAC